MQKKLLFHFLKEQFIFQRMLNNYGLTRWRYRSNKKNHPCGGKEWEVLRAGADFRIKCTTCGHMIMLPRVSLKEV